MTFDWLALRFCVIAWFEYRLGLPQSQWVMGLCNWWKFPLFFRSHWHSPRTALKPRSHCADLEVPISTTWKIVENGMIGYEVVAISYWHLGSLLGRETIGSDREASTTKFYCKTLSCWSWLWLRSIHGSISVVCGIGNVVGLSSPAWGHSWTACGYSWTAYGWSWRSDQYNHSKLSNWWLLHFHIF